MKPAIFDPNPETVTIPCPRCGGIGTAMPNHHELGRPVTKADVVAMLWGMEIVCPMCEGRKVVTGTREEIGRMWPNALKKEQETR